jgi:hypothetical protein
MENSIQEQNKAIVLETFETVLTSSRTRGTVQFGTRQPEETRSASSAQY